MMFHLMPKSRACCLVPTPADGFLRDHQTSNQVGRRVECGGDRVNADEYLSGVVAPALIRPI
jgi:hypothetical protein